MKLVALAHITRLLLITVGGAAILYLTCISLMSGWVIISQPDFTWSNLTGTLFTWFVVTGATSVLLYSLIRIQFKVLSDLIGVILGLVLMALWFAYIPTNELIDYWIDFDAIPFWIRISIGFPLSILALVAPFWFIIAAPSKISSRIHARVFKRLETVFRNTAEQGAAANP